MARNWPLFAGALLLASGAAAALSVTTQSFAFGLFIHTLIIIGILVSFVGVSIGKRTTAVGFVVIATGFVVLVLREELGPWTDMVFPLDLQPVQESTVAVLAAWALAGCCFIQGRRYSVVFLTAIGMAILGLMATLNLDTELLVCFWVYTFGVVFTWGYDHLLRVAEDSHVHLEDSEVWKAWLGWHLSASALLLVVVMIVATIGGSLLYAVSPNIFEQMSAQARRIPASIRSLTFRTRMDAEFRVGTGPIDLPHTVAFTVTAQHPTLWRTQAYNRYQGTGWTKRAEKYIRMQHGGFKSYRYSVARASVLPGTRNFQEFTLNSGPLRGFLPAATAPIQIQLYGQADDAPPLYRGGPRLDPVEVDGYGCLRINPTWASRGYWGRLESEPERHYEVVSVMPPTGAEALSGRGGDYSPNMVETYIKQVPVAAGAHLADLVQKTVAGIEDPYDRVAALREMISTRCLYSLKAPAVPRGKDAAAHFLLSSKRGACDLFATAMAVTARLAGVPARVAVGFQVGDYNADDETIVVRHSDAHAWAEVFFPGVGWVPFDVQPAQIYDEQSWLALFTTGHARLALARLLRLVVPVLLLLLVGYAALSGVCDLRRLAGWWRGRRAAGPREDLSRDYQRLCRQLARRAGIGNVDAMTPREAIQVALANLSGSQALKQRLFQLNEEFYRVRFAPHPPGEGLAYLRGQIGKMRKRIREFRHKPQRSQERPETNA